MEGWYKTCICYDDCNQYKKVSEVVVGSVLMSLALFD